MSDYLKQYRMELDTVGPVFIGSGREISKKEYIFVPKSEKLPAYISVMDIQKLYAFVQKRPLPADFENFMMNFPRMTLEEWLNKKHINVGELNSCVRYIVGAGDTQLTGWNKIGRDSGTKASIMEFMRDAQGLPYVPGSSIKGMLRTILLTEDIHSHPEKYRNEKDSLRREINAKRGQRVSRQGCLKRQAGAFEQRAFYTLGKDEKKPENAVNDRLSGLVVSDSEPLRNADLVLAQKVDLTTESDRKPLNLIRECIRPGKKICFTMTVDEKACPDITPEKIQKAITVFNDIYGECFLSSFKALGPRHDSVYLGGGAGYGTKTVLYAALGKEEGTRAAAEIFRATGVPQNHHHSDDVTKYKVSPHMVKLTRYCGGLKVMGECKVKIIEDKV
jgi:CRISPR-associated protein Csm5